MLKIFDEMYFIYMYNMQIIFSNVHDDTLPLWNFRTVFFSKQYDWMTDPPVPQCSIGETCDGQMVCIMINQDPPHPVFNGGACIVNGLYMCVLW